MIDPTTDYFETAVAYVIDNEIGRDVLRNGGFTFDKRDRGGATKWGITQKTLSEWRGYICSVDEVFTLSREEATKIYRALYWQKLSCHEIIRPQMAIAIMDMGVLFGIGTSARNAQLAATLGGYPKLTVDGLIGPKTLRALNTINSTVWCVNFQKEFFDRVKAIVKNDQTQARYRAGWENRIAKLKTLG